MTSSKQEIIPIEIIERRIYMIRAEKVMLDHDLAELYEVETKTLVRSVKRNIDRFPERFMFQLSNEEFQNLRCQIGTSSWGGRRYPPYAFTEHGVAMLSSVLRSRLAIQVNIAIIDTFIRLREILATHKELAQKIEVHDQQIGYLFSKIEELLAPPPPPKKNPIGFVPPQDDD